jgi:hypothetical protein
MANIRIPEQEQAREATAISQAVVSIHAGVLAVTCAVVGGLGLFILTAWLVIKGGPQVGLHLRLLGHYFPGYSVTWPGSIVGLLYGAVLGAVIGWAIGRIYNGVVTLRW